MRSRWGAVAILCSVAILVPAAPGAAASPRPGVATGCPAGPDPAPAPDLGSPYLGYLAPNIPLNTPTGPSADPNDTAKRLNDAHAAGLSWVFVYVAWSDLEPLPGQYNWSSLDSYLTKAHDAGLAPVVQVQIGAWSLPQAWAGPHRMNSRHPGVNAPPVDFAPLAGFWRALVDRYKPCGALATERNWPAYGVRAWELENEPDAVPLSWPNGDWSRMPRDYAAYLATVQPVIK